MQSFTQSNNIVKIFILTKFLCCHRTQVKTETKSGFELGSNSRPPNANDKTYRYVSDIPSPLHYRNSYHYTRFVYLYSILLMLTKVNALYDKFSCIIYTLYCFRSKYVTTFCLKHTVHRLLLFYLQHNRFSLAHVNKEYRSTYYFIWKFHACSGKRNNVFT